LLHKVVDVFNKEPPQMPSKKPTRVAKSARVKKPARKTAAIGPKATVVVAICVMAGGILIAARRQSRPEPIPAREARVEMSPVAAVPSKTFASSSPSDVTPVTSAPSASKAAPVTIIGCLERDGDAFQLKDASGADAPRARSWKSGFLKKGPATLDVVDASHTLKLGDQAGHRVSVTGTLADREMHARSLRRVGSSCTQH
jgi:hypothetical protein